MTSSCQKCHQGTSEIVTRPVTVTQALVNAWKFLQTWQSFTLIFGFTQRKNHLFVRAKVVAWPSTRKETYNSTTPRFTRRLHRAKSELLRDISKSFLPMEMGIPHFLCFDPICPLNIILRQLDFLIIFIFRSINRLFLSIHIRLLIAFIFGTGIFAAKSLLWSIQIAILSKS